MSCVVITDHARARYKERMGMSKSRMEKDAEQAWKNGVRWDEVSGSLRRYMDSQHFGSKILASIRVYCGRVYIFKNGALITVFELPPKYRRKGTEERIRSRREMENVAVENVDILKVTEAKEEGYEEC